MKSKELLSIGEVAKYANVTRQAVYQQIKKRLKDYVVDQNGKKYLRASVLSDIYGIDLASIDAVSASDQSVDQTQTDSVTKLTLQIEVLKAKLESTEHLLDAERKHAEELSELLKREQTVNTNLSETIVKQTETIDHHTVVIEQQRRQLNGDAQEVAETHAKTVTDTEPVYPVSDMANAHSAPQEASQQTSAKMSLRDRLRFIITGR